MKKVRLLMNTPPTDWTLKDGPGIASANDIYYLKNEPWLEIKNTSIEECKKDDVIPWLRHGCRPELVKCEELGIQMIIGPNCVFGCSDRPEDNFRELQSQAVYRLLMLDQQNIALAKKYCTYDLNRIQPVRHFMRPELYDEPFFYEHEWDIYCHVKGDINRFILSKFPNCTMTSHGWYKYKELHYKSQHSAVCIHGCAYDNYGIAVHEISLLGCPIVHDDLGMKPNTIGPGMGIRVNSVGRDDVAVLEKAVKDAMAMDRKKVWEASHEFQSVENCLNSYRKAILE